MTRITIDVSDSATVQDAKAPVPAEVESQATQPSKQTSAVNPGDVSGGGAPSVSASHTGPVPFSAAASQVSFDRASAISAGPAPEHLSNPLGNGVTQ